MSDPITSDPNDPRLGRGINDEPTVMNEAYLVLPAEERAKGFVRPLRRTYVHSNANPPCGGVTTMGQELAETYARDPKFYGATWCVRCARHRPVEEFTWQGTQEVVGS